MRFHDSRALNPALPDCFEPVSPVLAHGNLRTSLDNPYVDERATPAALRSWVGSMITVQGSGFSSVRVAQSALALGGKALALLRACVIWVCASEKLKSLGKRAISRQALFFPVKALFREAQPSHPSKHSNSRYDNFETATV